MLEALIAVGVAAMYMTGLAGLAVMAHITSDRAEEMQRALWHVQEGVDALSTVAFADLLVTDTGTLTLVNGKWIVGTGAAQALGDGMTRTVKVQTVQRDVECLVVASGGTVDPDSYALESVVDWTDSNGRPHSATSRTLRTRWDDPQGNCFGATMAMSVSWAVDGAVWSGGKQLRNLWFTNTGGNPATVDKISFTWTNDAELDQVFMDTSKVWSSTGPGTPLHSLDSGEEMNIQDFIVPAGAAGELNKGQFNINMVGQCLTMTVVFTDASSWTSPVFCPE